MDGDEVEVCTSTICDKERLGWEKGELNKPRSETDKHSLIVLASNIYSASLFFSMSLPKRRE